jgi:ACS family hexuronate transporter-like MFS transporter
VCGLLALAAVINYVDRGAFGVLTSSGEFRRLTGLDEIGYGYSWSVFMATYAVAQLLAGRLADRVGVRVGYLWAIAVWSLAELAHALASGPAAFLAARSLLGLGEAGCFPLAIKAIAERFPPGERALATGLFNAGASTGAVVGPLLVPLLYLHLGWRWTFIVTGLLGIAWMPAWAALTARAPAPAVAPRDGVGRPSPLRWAPLLRRRDTWAIVIAKALTDPIWFFYLAWLPPFLTRHHAVGIAGIGAPLAAVYLISALGGVGGGALAGLLIRRGCGAMRARQAVMLLCAVAVLPVARAAQVSSLWSLVALGGLATAAHQAWSSNLFTLASDRFPVEAVGRVVGLAGMAAALACIPFHAVVGHVVAGTGSYRALFVLAATVYLLALAVLALLMSGRIHPPAGVSDSSLSGSGGHGPVDDPEDAAVDVAGEGGVVAGDQCAEGGRAALAGDGGHQGAASRVQAVRGLVQDQQPGVPDQCRQQEGPLALAEGHRAQALGEAGAQAQTVAPPSHGWRDLVDALEGDGERGQLGHRQLGESVSGVGQVANPAAGASRPG